MRFEISKEQELVLTELLSIATDAYIAILASDPELAGRLSIAIVRVREQLGIGQ